MIGFEVVKREEIVYSHARPQGCREQIFSIWGPFVQGRREGLRRTQFGERDSVPDVEIARQLSKASTHQHSPLRTPHQLISRLCSQMTQCLALAIVQGGFAWILAISHSKIISLRIPSHIMDRAWLICHHITLSFTIRWQIIH